MSEIPLDEFFERIKRLLALFPNYVHVMSLSGLDYDENEFTGLLEKNHIMWKNIAGCFSVHLPECKTDNQLYYFERVYKPLKSETFYLSSGLNVVFGVDCIDLYSMFNSVPLENPYLPKLQCDIFDAIFGKAWMECYTFYMDNVGKLLLPRLEKIA